jgi:hypothetical protein
MLDSPLEAALLQVPHLTTPAMERAVELARELLKQHGWTDEEIDQELSKPPGSGFASF